MNAARLPQGPLQRVAPSVMEVTCCGDCPFLVKMSGVRGSVHGCYHDGASDGAASVDLDERPELCPLDVAPTVVRIARSSKQGRA